MEKYILNGEIYAKRRPTKREEYRILKSNFFVYNKFNEEEININDAENLNALPQEVLETLLSQKIIAKEQVIEHDNMALYQIYINNGVFYLIDINRKKNFKYSNLAELEQDFISLNDFLNRAVYIGRQLNGPCQHLELLYEFEGMILIGNAEEGYTIMNKNNPILNYYQMGSILPFYYSKEQIYQLLAKSLIKKDNDEARK